MQKDDSQPKVHNSFLNKQELEEAARPKKSTKHRVDVDEYQGFKDSVPVWVAVQCSFVEMARERQPRGAGLGDRQPVEQIETQAMLLAMQIIMITTISFSIMAFTCVSPGDWAGWGTAGGPVIG